MKPRLGLSRWLLACSLACSLASAAEPGARSIAVIAHRGAHRQHPENTLPALQAAIDLGADYVELDVRTSADGVLVLMHDRSVNRTTSGRGRVSCMTWTELQALDAGVKFGTEWRGTRVPSFAAALELARGRIGVYVDAKAVSASSLVEALRRSSMLEHAVVYGGMGLLREIARLDPAVRVMPEAWNERNLRFALERLPLRVVAFNSWDFSSKLTALAREAQLELFVDRLGRYDNPAGWQAAIERGATGIQTNHPEELLDYLIRSD
jgi:glycerophosphoryl diester phosphodiesterase